MGLNTEEVMDCVGWRSKMKNDSDDHRRWEKSDKKK